MTRQHCLNKLILIFTFLFSTSFLFSEIIQDKDFQFNLDIPEGFELAETSQDGMSYHFSHPNIPVHLVMKINTGNGFTSPEETLSTNIRKLKGKIEQDSFLWNKVPVSIGTFSMKLDQSYSGWALSTPTKIADYYLTLLCYAPAEKEAACQQFIMSTLNSLCIDEQNYNTPGIIVSYAFQPEGKSQIQLNIAKKSITTQLDSVDLEASQFVVDLEYAVLTLYAQHKLWKEAWQRYYRMIYRDNFYRLESVCSDVYDTLYPLALKQNPENPEIAYAQMLLSWVQSFQYRRADDPKKADFTALPCAITGTGNDCDSRSLLICALLKSAGVECLLLISPEYSHAMAAALIDAPGQKYELENGDYSFIMGETTAKVTWGMIAQEHSDRSKWIPVILP